VVFSHEERVKFEAIAQHKNIVDVATSLGISLVRQGQHFFGQNMIVLF